MKAFDIGGGIKTSKLSLQLSFALLALLQFDSLTLATEETVLTTTVDSQFSDVFSEYEVEISMSPFSCWACNSTDENDGCFNLTREYQRSDRIQQCMSHERYCKVERVWYVFGVNKSAHNFSIYRNCSSNCESYCLTMGDRTKLYSCAICCQQSLCNVGSTSTPSPSPTSKLRYGMLTLLILIFFELRFSQD